MEICDMDGAPEEKMARVKELAKGRARLRWPRGVRLFEKGEA